MCTVYTIFFLLYYHYCYYCCDVEVNHRSKTFAWNPSTRGPYCLDCAVCLILYYIILYTHTHASSVVCHFSSNHHDIIVVVINVAAVVQIILAFTINWLMISYFVSQYNEIYYSFLQIICNYRSMRTCGLANSLLSWCWFLFISKLWHVYNNIYIIVLSLFMIHIKIDIIIL